MHLDMAVDRLDPGSAVVMLNGALTLGTNLKIVDTNVQQLIEEGVRRMVLDMTNCSYSDSAGLGFLVHAYGLMTERGGSMRLCGVGERVGAMLKMTTMDKILPCDLDRQSSLDQMGTAGNA